MEPTYYIWSTTLQGWSTHGGVYSSELSDARKMGRSQALAFCILHFNKRESTFGLIPVSADDLDFIAGKK